MIKKFKKVFVGIMAASLLVGAVAFSPVNINLNAATISKGDFDFSTMTVRRVWFNTYDPVFLIDNYQRVWLDDNVNVKAYGDYKDTTSTGDFMAPMEEMFSRIGVSYVEDGNNITISMNGQVLKLTIGSKDVVLDGKTISNALTDAQVPVKVNVKENFGDFNTYLAEDYFVTYLPAAYILNLFGADMYVDSNVQSLYAAVPIFKTDLTPSYDTVAKGYGYRYDEFLEGALNDEYELLTSIADNIVALQNEDGGFCLLPDNIDLTQDNLASKLGSLKDDSSLENGSTVAQLRYLAKYITENKPDDDRYKNAFFKGLDFLLNNQRANGGWCMEPASAKGFNGNTEIGNKVTTEVLTLLQDIAVLNNQNFVFVRKSVDISPIKSALEKGNNFIVSSQLSENGTKSGWATQVKDDNTVTMGRTYERESVSSFTTKDVVDYLMSVHNPSAQMIDAVTSAVAWLKEVKIEDKELQIVNDTSMNNGFDVYLVDGAGTWASNYVYDEASNSYRPLYSDVDPDKSDQKLVNVWEPYTYGSDEILYATRTSIRYYDNSLADEIIDEGYDVWLSYIANGFPDIPQDPSDPEVPEEPTGPSNPSDTSNPSDGADTGDGDSISTGDSSNIILFGIICGGSLIIIAGYGLFVVYNKKKNTTLYK